ncbi:GNAT family N-acetyltransferase [Flindersiella endophytica]
MPVSPAIRPATLSDLTVVEQIYAHHVRTGTATFELKPPSLPELEKRYQTVVDRGLPYLVAEVSGAVVGYAYCGAYRPRPAYRHTVEDSVYLSPAAQGRGLGGALLRALIDECVRGGEVRQIIGVIAEPGGTASLALHRKCGFTEVGRLSAVGFKFGQWLDTVFTQRSL